MDVYVSGRNAEAVYRNKSTGERMSKEEFLKSQKDKQKKEEKPKEIKLEQSKGLAQKREAEARLEEFKSEKDKSFTRSRNDADLDRMLKERDRWGDPMAHLVTFGMIMNAQENQDSDQSISEEEGLEDLWKEGAVSLSDAPNNYKEGMRVVSQLEMLKDYREMHPTSDKHISSHERKMGFCADDEVENPCFNEDDDCIQYPRINSSNHYNEGPIFLSTMASILQADEETISDNEKINFTTLTSAKEVESSTWIEASMEVKALICLHENSGCSSSHGVTQNAYKSCKGGGKAKSKPKFSFHYQPRKEDLPLVGGDGNLPILGKIAFPNAISSAVHKDMGRVMVENQLVGGEEVELPENHIAPFELSRQHDFKENSMAESLIQFHERSVLMLGSSEMENHQNTKSIIPRTMADPFHEVFGTVSVNDEQPPLALPGPLCDGLFKRLQRVVLIEKERELAPLKISNTGTNSLDERSCISVRILSRSLEAKLTVCTCTSIEDGEDSLLNSLQMKMRNAERILTIIFSSKMCSNVNLEVGNIIRLHRPWKEVQVMQKDAMVILCSYYSQVQEWHALLGR